MLPRGCLRRRWNSTWLQPLFAQHWGKPPARIGLRHALLPRGHGAQPALGSFRPGPPEGPK
eukprot:7598534-Alexandrium_andersonii.AAC.1